MRNLIFITGLLLLPLLAIGQTENPEPNKSPFLVEAGRIKYRVESIRGNGEKELIFDAWGYRQRETSVLIPADSNAYGRGRSEIRIKTPERNWSINLKSKAGLKMEILTPARSPLANARLQISGEPILGYKSMKVKDDYTTAWVYQGIILKLEIRDPTSGQLIRREEAIEIEIPYTTTDESFEAPANINFY